MALPPLPPFQLSTGPQVTDAPTQVTVNPVFGGGFFDRGGSASSDLVPLLLVGGAAVIGLLIISGKLKF